MLFIIYAACLHKVTKEVQIYFKRKKSYNISL